MIIIFHARQVQRRKVKPKANYAFRRPRKILLEHFDEQLMHT